MTEIQNRRRFLQTTLAAGTALTVGAASSSQGHLPVPDPSPAEADNPAARPGRVDWRENFAAACAAARDSGKPVLLFHMMGRLDQKFC